MGVGPVVRLSHEAFAERLVSELKSITLIDADSGDVSFSGFAFDEYTCLLADLLEWNPELPSDEARARVSTALFEASRPPGLTLDRFLAANDRLESGYLSRAPERYVLLSQVSIDTRVALPRAVLDGVTVMFPERIPASFEKSRDPLMTNASHSLSAPLPKGYRWVRASVAAKSAHTAAEKALSSVELLIALWNLGINRGKGFRWSAGRRKPVNTLALFPVHTLHRPSGKLAGETWWYEPGYVGGSDIFRGDFSSLLHFVSAVRGRLGRITYSDYLKDCIRYYGRATGEADWTLSFMLLWQALESVTDTCRRGYADTVRRAAFLFGDVTYHTSVLEDLRRCRNELVHQQRDPASLESKMYILKRYVEAGLLFHLGHAGHFRSLEEAGQFLDLPSDSKLLRRRLELIAKAAQFRES
jgi:hypothetical protein